MLLMLYERNHLVSSRGRHGMISSKRKLFGKLNNISFSVTALYPVHLLLKNADGCNVHSSLILKSQLFCDYCY